MATAHHSFDLLNFMLEEEEYSEQVEQYIITEIISSKKNNPCIRQPMHTDIGRGHRWIHELMSGHVGRSYSTFRVHPRLFMRLRDMLMERNVLKDTKNMTATEQLAIFLLEVGHGIGNRLLREWFQHSSETISRHFNNVLTAVLTLRHDYIKLSEDNSVVHPKIRGDPKFYPHFKNAIGAIDGTHVSAKVSIADQPRYRNRKGEISQNVLGCVNFDLLFTYVLVGWEGSAADMTVLRWAIENGGFTVPEGKYYLVDAGYANTHEFLAPYRGTRYHLAEYSTSGSRLAYKEKKDLFNHRHAQLRNIVERAFGVLKMRFTILVKRRSYPIKTQAKIVMASCVLHNFIRKEQGMDYIFRRGECDIGMEGDDDMHESNMVTTTSSARGNVLRENIANRLWTQRQRRGPSLLQDENVTN